MDDVLIGSYARIKSIAQAHKILLKVYIAAMSYSEFSKCGNESQQPI